jgi:lysophospholipase L1-like esterase
MCIRYANMSNDADIIAISGGTNDFYYAWTPIGTIDSTGTDTFYGALKTLCEGLITKYPKKPIFFTTPLKRSQPFTDGNGGEYTPDGVMLTPFSKNKYGKTLMDYADIIKEVCGYYSIPVLDVNRESLLNPHITAQQDMFDNVLTHPNDEGRKIMARRVCGWLMQLGYFID